MTPRTALDASRCGRARVRVSGGAHDRDVETLAGRWRGCPACPFAHPKRHKRHTREGGTREAAQEAHERPTSRA
eukprot:526340-Prorocentrum_minimum.AAC.2